MLANTATISPEYSSLPNLTPERLSAFRKELEAIDSEMHAKMGEEDIKHLLAIERRGRICTFLGYLTAWIIPNPISAFLLSFGHFTRWMLAHHILHRGYDKVPGIPEKYTSRKFARGWRRFIDWFDWIHPEAWDYEHNILHHYHTQEHADPDLVERHAAFVRNAPVPKVFKYFAMILAAMTWKYTYYAPNTLSVIDPKQSERIRHKNIVYITLRNVFDFSNAMVRKLWLTCYIPYAGFHFIVIPALFLPLGKTAAMFVLINKILAECITNMHAFLVIGPNHTGDDIPRFSSHYDCKDQFFVSQICSSVNFRCGTEFLDHMQIWLNYQIEHHVFPYLPMLRYREVQPRVKALCAQYGVPYVQDSIWRRFGKMVDICVANTSAKVVPIK